MSSRAVAEKSHFFPEGFPYPKKKKEEAPAPNPEWFWGLGAEMLEIQRELLAMNPRRSQLNTLVIGETGTGKEYIAQFLHKLRKEQLRLSDTECPFIAINSGAIPENLAESVLFGHERGAFTSARERQYGKFELARKGTLFLDEIQNLSLATQAKLLRTLQNREFDRIGAKVPQAVECQIIAASNVPLEILVEKKTFRKDLYYRLNICPFYLPALRHRKEDLPLLIKGLLTKLRKNYLIEAEDLDTDAYEVFLNYAWPGNIRELEYSLLYAGLRSQKLIHAKELPPALTGRLLSYLSAGSWAV